MIIISIRLSIILGVTLPVFRGKVASKLFFVSWRFVLSFMRHLPSTCVQVKLLLNFPNCLLLKKLARGRSLAILTMKFFYLASFSSTAFCLRHCNYDIFIFQCELLYLFNAHIIWRVVEVQRERQCMWLRDLDYSTLRTYNSWSLKHLMYQMVPVL